MLSERRALLNAGCICQRSLTLLDGEFQRGVGLRALPLGVNREAQHGAARGAPPAPAAGGRGLVSCAARRGRSGAPGMGDRCPGGADSGAHKAFQATAPRLSGGQMCQQPANRWSQPCTPLLSFCGVCGRNVVMCELGCRRSRPCRTRAARAAFRAPRYGVLV